MHTQEKIEITEKIHCIKPRFKLIPATLCCFVKARPFITNEQKAEMQSRMEQALSGGRITREQYDSFAGGERPKLGKRGSKTDKPERSNEINDMGGKRRNSTEGSVVLQ